MIEIYGSEEAYKEVRRNAGRKARGVSKNTPLTNNPERAAQLQRLSVEARLKNKESSDD
jgi:hypothetical protein